MGILPLTQISSLRKCFNYSSASFLYIFQCQLAAKKWRSQILNYLRRKNCKLRAIHPQLQFNLIDTDPHPPVLTLETFQWGAASLLRGTSTSLAPSASPRLARLRRRRILHKVASSSQRQIISSITTYGK